MKIMLSKEQIFKLAKKYIDNNDIDGFDDSFMFMTKQMMNHITSEIERPTSFIEKLFEEAQKMDKETPVINPLNNKPIDGAVYPRAYIFLRRLIARVEANKTEEIL